MLNPLSFTHRFVIVVDSDELLSAPMFKRGHRFDRLYEEVVATGRLESLLSKNLDLPEVVWQRLRWLGAPMSMNETNIQFDGDGHPLPAETSRSRAEVIYEKGTATAELVARKNDPS